MYLDTTPGISVMALGGWALDQLRIACTRRTFAGYLEEKIDKS
jgi:hypothetical protein